MHLAIAFKLSLFQLQVVNEINRITTVIPGGFRKALTDVEVNGKNFFLQKQ